MHNQTSYFDDKGYWKNRHERQNNLEASGLKSVGMKANFYIYKILEDQYLKLLKHNLNNIEDVKTILDCGYGDGYFIKFFQDNYPKKQIFGVDISESAKSKVDFVKNQDNLLVGDLTNFDFKRKFDLVHCFDVLYHVLREDDYRKALSNIASHSNNYVILHEKFSRNVSMISAPHVRFRRREFTNQILNSKGFYLYSEVPTHFFAMRLLTYRLNKFIPGILYRIDNAIAKKYSSPVQEVMASHWIRVYKRTS